MSRPRRVLGYARVSSAEQALGTSLADQQAAITAFAASRGLTVTRFYVESESGGRARLEHREQMQSLMRDVRDGDLVLVDKIDRWSRDAEFSYGSVRKILELDAGFYAVAERIDPSTSEGDSAMSFRILFAREEHKRIRQRTVGTRNLLRDQGYYVEGTPPFGYQRAKPKGWKGVEKNRLVVVPEQAALVKRMFRMAAAGSSLAQIASALNVGKYRVHHCLRNRHYLGEVRNSRGEWMPGTHEALVSPDTFERANRLLAERKLGGPRPRDAIAETNTWVLRDLARCALCGAKMGPAYAGPKGPKRRHYYRCVRSCESRGPRVTRRSFVPVREADGKVGALILARLGELREELARGPELTGPSTADLETRRRKLEKKRERHLEAHAEELMTRDELRKALARLDAERLRLAAEEAALAAQNALASAEVRRETLRELAKLEEGWRGAPPAGKREIAAQLATAVHLHGDRDPVPAWRPLSELAADVT